MQRPRLSIDIHPDLGKNPPTDETSTLGPRSDNRARWSKFADCALHPYGATEDCALHPYGATEEDIAELIDLVRDEQKTIKSHIEHTSHVVKRQSKSKH
jgi:hypothetical protein